MAFLSGLTDLSGLGGALLAFVGLVLLAILVVKLGRRSRSHRAPAGAGHRLAVVDQIPIDDLRRLVLIQRDDVQHLVILGGTTDFLVEGGIGRAVVRAPAPAAVPVAAPPAPAASAPSAPPPAPVVSARREEPAPIRPASPPPQPVPEAPPKAVVVAPAPVVPATVPPLSARRVEAQAAERPAPSERIAPQPRVSAPERPAPMPERTERAEPPRVRDAEPASNGPRVAVKLDPHFAGMVEELEDTLRRPVAASTEAPARRPAPPVPPVAMEAPAPRTIAPPPAPPVRASTLSEADAAPEIVAPASVVNAKPSVETSAPDVLPPSANTEPRAAAPIPVVTPDDAFEAEMASILGRPRKN